jgi:hypothetical protein
MQYAVYIAVPLGEDAERIVSSAASVAPPGFGFALREHSDPSESADAELFFRVTGVDHPAEALERALEVYEAAREELGLPRDLGVEPSLEPRPRGSERSRGAPDRKRI